MGVLVFLYDTYDMNRLAVGVSYLGRWSYYPNFFLRWAYQLAAAGVLFRGGTWLLQGNQAMSAPNIVGGIGAASGIAVLNVWRERIAAEDPKLTSLFGFFQVWKISIVEDIINAKHEAITQRLLRNSDWLLKRLGTAQLNKVYLQVHRDKHGPHAIKDARAFLRACRKKCAKDESTYRRTVADGIGQMAFVGRVGRILHLLHLGRYRAR